MSFQKLAQTGRLQGRGQYLMDAAFERVPPEFGCAGGSQKHDRNEKSMTPDAFDQIPPISIRQGQFRYDNRLILRRFEELQCRRDRARPVHHKSIRFKVSGDGYFGASDGDEDYRL